MNVKSVDSDRLMYSVFTNGIGGKHTTYLLCVVLDRRQSEGSMYRSFIGKDYGSYAEADAAGEAIIVNARSSWEMTCWTIEQLDWNEFKA